MQVAGVFHHLAAQAFTLLFALAQALVSLAYLRAGQATAVDRDVQLQANTGLFHVAAVAHAQLRRVGKAEVVVVTLLVLGHCIQGRRMAGLALAQGLFGGGNRIVGGQQVEVLAAGGFDPGLGVVWRWYLHRQGMHHALDRGVFTVGQGDQRFKGILHLALGDDPVGPGRVVAGLGLQHVGLVRQAHIEALVGLVQLALECGFLGLGRGQVVLGAKHGEVVLRALQDQVLLGSRQLQRRLFVDRLGRLQLEPTVSAEDRLRQGRAPGIAAAVAGGRRLVELGAGVQHLGIGRQVRQQSGAGLRHHFAAGAIIGAGRGQVGVVVHRLLVNADQVGLHCRGHVRCPDHSVGRTRHGYCQ
ncbi:hypothetical protein D3C81_1299530 [compost metagenome]